MTREELIRNLKYTMKKHENDTVSTFGTNISLMCKDVLDYLEQEPILDKIRAEINRQEKWLLQAGYTAYNVDIAFDTIKAILAESEEKKNDKRKSNKLLEK